MYCIASSTIHELNESGYYFQRTEGRRLSSKLHSHDFYEFLLVTSGECVHKMDETEEKISEGDLIFITPGISHKFLSQSENCNVIALSVIPKEMDVFFSVYGTNNLPCEAFVLRLTIEKYRVLLERCEMITYERNERYIFQLRSVLNLIFLFGTELKVRRQAIPPEFEKVMEKMKTLENASQGISAFLNLSGYSHSQLCRLTQKYIGMTPTEYINQIRMSFAYDMIVYGTEDYETICEAVGFESFSYFCKLLKKSFGCSAAKLRNRIVTV